MWYVIRTSITLYCSLWFLVSMLLPSCLKLKEEVRQPAVSELLPEPVPELPPEKPRVPDFLTIIAGGDNLFHDVMIRPSRKTGSYNFDSYYTAVKPLIESADIAFINQETLLAGKDFGFSGYPRFNTPQELGLTLIAVGFDVINHANNHVMDKGEKGVFATMDFWDSHPEITYLGIHRSQDLRDRPIIIEKNHIKLGFLAYTYGTNGLPAPRDKPYLVSLIDTAVMAKEIDALRPLCDFLIVSMHWGLEYEHTYNARQERLSTFLAEHQVDLVIGHHPHVLQPVVSLPRADGGSTLCVYSLGNFISAQTMNATLLGGLLYVKIKKTESRSLIEKAGVIPVVTHYEENAAHFQVYPLYDYTKALAEKHWNTARSSLSLAYLQTQASTILGDHLMDYNPFAGSD